MSGHESWENNSDDEDEIKHEKFSDDDEEDEDVNNNKKRSFSEFKMEQNNDSDQETEENKASKKKLSKTISMIGEIPKGAKKYLRGDIVESTGITNPALKHRVREINIQKVEAAKSLQKSEILLEVNRGFIEPDRGEHTHKYSQLQISKNVDIQSSAKIFDLNLTPNGPYSVDFTRNGRYLLLGGEKGHFSIIDWTRGKKIVEKHLQSPIRDICFLHNETMFATAEKKYTYIYSDQGVQLHHMKEHFDPKFLEFLNFHFLLVTITNRGKLIYEDVSVGQKVSSINLHGQLACKAKNPYNAVINLGFEGGHVDMFVPNAQKSVVRFLAHRTAITSMAVNITGNYMVTSGRDSMVKVFDLRNTYEEIKAFKTDSPVRTMALSDMNVLALGLESKKTVIWKNPFSSDDIEPYLIHKTQCHIKDLQFCPLEDVLGIGTEKGYSSILVPGAGQPNYDSFEADPFASKKMAKEKEITELLEKIPYTMITLDPNIIGTVQEGTKTEEDKYKRQDRKMVDRNRIPIDPEKLEQMKKTNKERKDKKKDEILQGTHRSALSRFENR